MPRTPPPTSLKIVGGIEDSGGSFPDVVAILAPKTQRAYCSGTVIAKKLVVTAAHCVLGLKPGQDLPLVLGLKPAKVYIAKRFEPNGLGFADIAVLAFSQELSLSPSRARQVELSASGLIPRTTELTLVGFGCAVRGLRDESPTRRFGTNILNSFGEDDGRLTYQRGDEDHAPKGRVSACAADSGGAVLAAQKLVGVIAESDGDFDFAAWIGSEDALQVVGAAAKAVGEAIKGIPEAIKSELVDEIQL